MKWTDTTPQAVKQMTAELSQSPDCVSQEIEIDKGWSLYCVYLASIVSANQVDEMILKPLFAGQPQKEKDDQKPVEWLIHCIRLFDGKS